MTDAEGTHGANGGFFARRRGGTGMNYTLALGLIAVVVILVILSTGEETERLFCAIAKELDPTLPDDCAALVATENTAPRIAFAAADLATDGLIFHLPNPGERLGLSIGPIAFTIEDEETATDLLTVEAAILPAAVPGQPSPSITALDPVAPERSLSILFADGEATERATFDLVLTVTDDDPEQPLSTTALLSVSLRFGLEGLVPLSPATVLLEPQPLIAGPTALTPLTPTVLLEPDGAAPGSSALSQLTPTLLLEPEGPEFVPSGLVPFPALRVLLEPEPSGGFGSSPRRALLTAQPLLEPNPNRGPAGTEPADTDLNRLTATALFEPQPISPTLGLPLPRREALTPSQVTLEPVPLSVCVPEDCP